MERNEVSATLIGVASLLLLAGCSTAPPPPPVTLSVTTANPVSAKARLYVVENFSANFGNNERLFRDRIRALAQPCQAAVDFFEMPKASGELSLDPDIASTQADFNRRIAAFQPDGILEVTTTGWRAQGTLGASPSTQLSFATFTLQARLLDGKQRSQQWRATGTLNVKADSGGELLAAEIIRLLAANGALPHCPK